jgi:hypothetical protein
MDLPLLRLFLQSKTQPIVDDSDAWLEQDQLQLVVFALQHFDWGDESYPLSENDSDS